MSTWLNPIAVSVRNRYSWANWTLSKRTCRAIILHYWGTISKFKSYHLTFAFMVQCSFISDKFNWSP